MFDYAFGVYVMYGYSSTDSGMELPQNILHAYKWQLTFQNWMQSTI